MINRVKDKLRSGERVLGSFIGFYSPNFIEMIGYAGFDFVVIDDEHGAFSSSELENMIRTAESVDLVPIVRVSYDPSSIQKALDRGAKGVQVPMVNSKEDAIKAVKRAKFPPLGTRGVAYSHRAARYGNQGGKAFLDSSDENILVIPHIETLEAVENIGEIMGVEGIDVLFIGTTDLSVDMGFKEEGANHPEVQGVIRNLYQTASENNVAIGTVAADSTGAQQAFEKGANYVGVVANSVILKALQIVVEDTKRVGNEMTNRGIRK
ncbi:HpcH/HpaI aldolase/citrate lyase family protein [Rossellomorea sp. y25]|uniref:HpcH/HpaI aldolase family protein n=1 Tax=Rossellomorea sp. y25 TaxID=3118174 RepID=UPI00263919FD|nr:aldolase/citrate lyase family protein [uncultured Rossellomorea sp.]